MMKLRSFGHRVAMAGREVIHYRHFVTLPKQFLGAHRPHVTGAACNQHSTHSHSAELQLQAADLFIYRRFTAVIDAIDRA